MKPHGVVEEVALRGVTIGGRTVVEEVALRGATISGGTVVSRQAPARLPQPPQDHHVKPHGVVEEVALRGVTIGGRTVVEEVALRGATISGRTVVEEVALQPSRNHPTEHDGLETGASAPSSTTVGSR